MTMNAQALQIEKTETMPANGIEHHESPALRLLENALVSPDVPAERIDKALEWMDRLERKESIAAFNRDFAAMQAEMPVVPKNGRGHQNSKYSTLEDIIQKTKPVLTKYGFGLNWTNHVDHQGKCITVTANLSHRGGHSISNTGVYPFDASGSKNAIQSIGSAQTYGQRYTGAPLLGIAMGDGDDDGAQAGNAELITDEQCIQLRELIEAKGANEAKFNQYFGIASLSALPAKRLDEATAMLSKKAAS